MKKIYLFLILLFPLTLSAQIRKGNPSTGNVEVYLNNNLIYKINPNRWFQPVKLTIDTVANGATTDSLLVINNAEVRKLAPLIFTNGLSNSSGTVSSDFFTGKSGGNTLTFGTGSGDGGTIRSTSNATKGTVNIDGVLYVNGNNGFVNVGSSSTPVKPFVLNMSSGVTGGMAIVSSAALSNISGGVLTLAGLAPSGVDQRIGAIGFGRGLSDGTTNSSAAIEAYSDSAWTPTTFTTRSSYLSFFTWGNSASSRAEAFRLTSNQSAIVGGTITSPRATLTVNGTISTVVSTITATTTLDATASTILANNSSDIVVNLPAASGCSGRKYFIKKISNNANTVTITPASGTIDGSSTLVLSAQWKGYQIQSDGSSWQVISSL